MFRVVYDFGDLNFKADRNDHLQARPDVFFRRLHVLTDIDVSEFGLTKDAPLKSLLRTACPQSNTALTFDY